MISGPWQWLKRLPALLAVPRPEPLEHAQRIVAMQRHIVIPARLVVIGSVLYHLYSSPWLMEVVDTYGVVFEAIQTVFTIYAMMIVAATALFLGLRRFPPQFVQWLVFVVGLGDGVFLGALTVLTGGFDSTLYWVYPAVIVLNALSIPLAMPQIVLNLTLSIFYLGAGLIATTATDLELPSLPRQKPRQQISASDIRDLPALVEWLKQGPEPMPESLWFHISDSVRSKLSASLWEQLTETTRANVAASLEGGTDGDKAKEELARDLNRLLSPAPPIIVNPEPSEVAAGPYVLHVAVLVLLTFCCYGVQALVAGQRRALEEQKEFGFRTGQLRAAGRLAAEFAHQIKNPLAIMNNVMFSLQRALKDEKPEALKQVEIAQEEVAKIDRIITQIMGYSQLSEGRVERLNVIEETEYAVQEVLPPTLHSEITLHREYEEELPPLLMQRRHFAESIGNLLQNARDVLGQGGNVYVGVRCLADESVEITIRDDGPGISPDKLERVFEAYYTTKERGTGLGLAIVKHNVELYGGTVRVESELGKGAVFTVNLPARTFVTPAS